MELQNSKECKKEVLTLEEACAYTGLSKSKMYKHTHQREIPHYKPQGKKIYFKREELISWLLSNRVKTIQELEDESIKYLLNNTLM